jgi:hypothetical protein
MKSKIYSSLQAFRVALESRFIQINSRVKDLVDIVLLTRNFKINKERMLDSFKQTFKIARQQARIPKKENPAQFRELDLHGLIW